ncbi:MAG: hypothetical protein PHG66_00735 [Candidatus Colwellbacteria bacterium]|nr:hypothetical protein [Candidatus Colwellbacteria bacterium]
MASFFGKSKKTVKKKSTQEEFTFTLSNIDVAKIDKDFNMEKMKEFGCDITGKNIIFDTEGTSLEKLGISSLHREPITTIVAKDKKKIYSYLSLIDIVSRKKIPEETNIPCHGCRRKFSSQPLSIPIEFHPSYYFSKNDPTKIKRLTTREKEKLELDKENNIVELDYFDTEGIVCSFNCIISCIEECPSPIYKKTPYLISMMYKMIFGKYPDQKILKAPSWKMRSEYGGPLSDDEFERSLQTIQFTDTHQCQKVQRVINPVGRIFEVKEIDINKQ